MAVSAQGHGVLLPPCLPSGGGRASSALALACVYSRVAWERVVGTLYSVYRLYAPRMKSLGMAAFREGRSPASAQRVSPLDRCVLTGHGH